MRAFLADKKPSFAAVHSRHCQMSSFADNILDVQSSRSGERVAGFIQDQRANMDAAGSEHLAASEGSPPLVRLKARGS